MAILFVACLEYGQHYNTKSNAKIVENESLIKISENVVIVSILERFGL